MLKMLLIDVHIYLHVGEVLSQGSWIHFEVINFIKIKEGKCRILINATRYAYLNIYGMILFFIKHQYTIPLTSYVISDTSDPPLATLLTHFQPRLHDGTCG